jgi:hypothetical protein
LREDIELLLSTVESAGETQELEQKGTLPVITGIVLQFRDQRLYRVVQLAGVK